MTPRGTLGLLGLAAVLVAYLLLVPAPAPPPLPESLLAAPVESIDALDVTWPDASVRVRRAEDGWRSDGGVTVAPDAIRDLLGTLATLRPTETLRGSDLGDYGLDARATKLVVGASGVTVLEMEIGDRNPAWTGVYVRRSGSNEVLVVGALLHWELEKLHAMATR